MLKRVLVFAGLVVVVATVLPRYLQRQMDTIPEAPPTQTVMNATPAPAQGLARALLTANAQGHFVTTFRINGKAVEGMIDTGASSVAINETTARRLGFGASDLDFKYKVTTANGQTAAAAVMLDRVEVDGVRVQDVRAIVLQDKALSGTLIGMTFLEKLGSYKVENGQMRLSQR
ncbi:TIGR02281 family clan AA aspartic protease [Agrobacterium vitis]|uniref:TIGR02281 family clan AA aspartic protease n=1 Tax=Rhizobium/Agrobacterium group TaxID=227290 RepID=UPI0012E8ABEE|nr:MULTISPECIES: TIGR02281 family clan AA aspartic protease [Rhizobium/Agrobacterium group]MCF1493314.1 TIGR02281 family clan AA aspartic protease [Allorhizobium ampelinum]MVA46891.1 TIGR02281 family clan AA aspartic protease [Agrobacterium vitis]